MIIVYYSKNIIITLLHISTMVLYSFGRLGAGQEKEEGGRRQKKKQDLDYGISVVRLGGT